MNISFYNGASGLIAYQSGMEQVAQNIANVNTVGYKATRPEFESLLTTEMYTNEVQPLRGHGVKMGSADLLYRQSSMQQTGMKLDFMIMDDGFFAVEQPVGQYGSGEPIETEDENGEVQATLPEVEMERVYTRAGAFDIGLEPPPVEEGEEEAAAAETQEAEMLAFLVDGQGRYVLTSEGQRIQIPRNDDGTFDLEHIADRIGVFRFDNPYGLERLSDASFRETAVSGQATPIWKNGLVRAQALEASGSIMADEMTNMIIMQRAYQLSARVVSTADEMEEIVNNLR